MNDTVEEWKTKADRDFATAKREMLAAADLNYDAVCFHAQQCIEKLMKALLIERGTPPPRIHDLVHLDRLLVPLVPGWSWSAEELRYLTRAAVGFRYPGESADKSEASKALDVATRTRAELLRLFA